MSAHRIHDHLCRRSEQVAGKVLPMNERSYRSRKSPKVTQTLHQCWVDHLFYPLIGYEPRVGYRRHNSVTDEWLFQQQASSNLFTCSSEFIAFRSLLSPSNRGYEKEAKVVTTVTVEWTPGIIRILVDPRTNVEDTIKLVLDKYTQEGRRPRLHKDAASSHCFDLHVSHFSLLSLDRSESIGATGSRSFYLRRNNKERQSHRDNRLHVAATTLLRTSEDVFVEGNSLERIWPPAVVVPFISRKFCKIVKKLLSLFKLVDCLHLR